MAKRVMQDFFLEGSPTNVVELLLPEGSVIKWLSPHGSRARIWVECDPLAQPVLYRFWMVPTGFEVPEGATWIGMLSIQSGHSMFPMHFYVQSPTEVAHALATTPLRVPSHTRGD